MAILAFDQERLGTFPFQERKASKENEFYNLKSIAGGSSDDILTVCANYNLGLATFQGFNPEIKSGTILEKSRDYWILAAGGDERSLIKPIGVKASDIFDTNLVPRHSEINVYRSLAQCKLGQLYTYESEHQDFKKAFFWHTEAAGNGNVESQGALGAMYLNGAGTRVNEKAGLYCLKSAAHGKNLYARGRLCEYYYKKKLFSHCLEYGQTWAVKLIHEPRENLIKEIEKEANFCHNTLTFAIKGAVLCAFYVVRAMENGHGKNIEYLNEVNDVEIKIYKACARLDAGLMVQLQEMRLQNLV